MPADCGKLKNSNCFKRAHKGDFPKFGHIFFMTAWQHWLGIAKLESLQINSKCLHKVAMK